MQKGSTLVYFNKLKKMQQVKINWRLSTKLQQFKTNLHHLIETLSASEFHFLLRPHPGNKNPQKPRYPSVAAAALAIRQKCFVRWAHKTWPTCSCLSHLPGSFQRQFDSVNTTVADPMTHPLEVTAQLNVQYKAMFTYSVL